MEMRTKTYQKRWAERKKDLEKPEWQALAYRSIPPVDVIILEETKLQVCSSGGRGEEYL